jgi:signal transduction histidine kinase
MGWAMKFWPKSLYRQILLVAALALLVAQAFNAYMLLAGSRSRADAEAAATLISRVSNHAERLEERGRDWEYRQREGRQSEGRQGDNQRRKKPNIAIIVSDQPLHLPQFSKSREHTFRAGEFLGPQSGLSDIMIATGPFFSLPDDLREPLMRGSFLARIRAAGNHMPSDSLLLTAKTTDGNWISAAAFVRPRERGAFLAILLQTLTLYIAVLIPLALVARRIVRPLERLKERVGRVGLTGEVTPLASEGPSDIRDLIDSFNNMQARVSALLSEKDVMLGAIGHDLKTPLAALRVRIESVEDDAERDKMADSIDELVRILDDILTLARLGKSGEALQRSDMAALIESIIDEFEATGAAAAFVPPDDRVIADVRPLLIRRALRNIISNALKHGKTATISVQHIGGNLQIIVDDEGPGIPAERIEDMFAPFARADASRNRATGGTGLGLTIARAIARSHGGDVSLLNRTGGGLRAILQLPMTV